MIVIQIELNVNAMSVPSDETHFGRLSFVILPAKYAILEPNSYNIPINPGTCPSIAANTSIVAIGDAHCAHNVNKKTYDIYVDVNKVLKEVFYKKLNDDSVGYARVTMACIFAHFWANYGIIDDNQLTTNVARMAASWSSPLPSTISSIS